MFGSIGIMSAIVAFTAVKYYTDYLLYIRMLDIQLQTSGTCESVTTYKLPPCFASQFNWTDLLNGNQWLSVFGGLIITLSLVGVLRGRHKLRDVALLADAMCVTAVGFAAAK